MGRSWGDREQGEKGPCHPHRPQASAWSRHFQRTVRGYSAENQSSTVNPFFMTINHICIYKH